VGPRQLHPPPAQRTFAKRAPYSGLIGRRANVGIDDRLCVVFSGSEQEGHTGGGIRDV
jgi:hypothetical protein